MLNEIETIAKKILTAKTYETASKWNNKLAELSQKDRDECIALTQTQGNENLIGNYAIYPNSYLIGGNFKG